MSALIPSAGPFEAIRRTDVSGSEYWSARDLMPLLGYDRWENFTQSINRAFLAAGNSEDSAAAEQHFRNATKMLPIGNGAERAVGDRHLTRYACYLVAMNGDPRKPEIAAAQTYFAVKTREAEVSKPVHEMDELEVAEKYVAALRAKRALELVVAEQAPKAEAFDTYMDADNALGMGAVANQLGIGRNTMMRKLREASVLQKDNRPYQRYAHHFKVVATTYEAQNSTRATHTTYVKPSGVELIRKVLSGGKGLLSIPGGAA